MLITYIQINIYLLGIEIKIQEYFKMYIIEIFYLKFYYICNKLIEFLFSLQ